MTLSLRKFSSLSSHMMDILMLEWEKCVGLFEEVAQIMLHKRNPPFNRMR